MLTVLTKPKWHERLAAFAACDFAETLDDLSGGDCLCAFMTGVIVPPEVLARYNRAYNVHPAPPAYPGRDPHHWAAYDGATTWGATLHVMAEHVDAGPICAVAQADVDPADPETYRQIGTDLALCLFAGHAEQMTKGPLPLIGQPWTGPRRQRRDLLAMLDLRAVPGAEAARRRFAFQGFEQHVLD